MQLQQLQNWQLQTLQLGMGKIGLRPGGGGGHGCRLKEGGGFGKWTHVTGPMYVLIVSLFFLLCYPLSNF